MIIKTITCHNVYNYGASLQAFALMKYLEELGHNVEIIDYMPKYIVDTLSIWAMGNRWKKRNVIIKLAFYCYVIPTRLLNKRGRKKFDAFTHKYLRLTQRYNNFDELCSNPPQADVYFAGSDQIWNTNIQNGLDPAFYLDFAPSSSVRSSYAASFSMPEIPSEYRNFVKSMLKKLNFISVRESTGVRILRNLDPAIKEIQVVDPVFLLNRIDWEKMIYKPKYRNYILVYDQENNLIIKNIALYLAKKTNSKIVAFKDLYPRLYADYSVKNADPIDFISLIANANTIITNSFHCMAFSTIFEKDFYIVPRIHQKVNSRMADLLSLIGNSDRLISQVEDVDKISPIDYKQARIKLNVLQNISYQYINTVLHHSDTKKIIKSYKT